MEKQYYYLNSKNEQQGPFNLNQFLLQELSPQTLVWGTGMDDWVVAVKMPELKKMFSIPPPVPGEANIQQKIRIKENPVRKFFRLFLAVIFLLVSIVCIAGFISTKGKAVEAIVFGVIFLFIAIVLFVVRPKGGPVKQNEVEGMLFAQGMNTADFISDDFGDFD